MARSAWAAAREERQALEHQLKLAQYEAAVIRRAYLHARSLLNAVVKAADLAMSEPSALNCNSLAGCARIGRRYLEGSKQKLRRLLKTEAVEKKGRKV